MSEPLPNEAPEPAPDAAGVLVAVDRATAELRRGGLVLIHDRPGDPREGGPAALVQAAEAATEASLARLRATAGAEALLALTAQRAAVLGLRREAGTDSVVLLPLDAAAEAGLLRRLADPTAPAPAADRVEEEPAARPAPDGIAGAAVDLTKLARLLPAAVICRIGPSVVGSSGFGDWRGWAAARDLLAVAAADIAAYRTAAARSLRPVGEARVPLADAEKTRIVAFRPSDGGIEHLAIIIGDPSPDEPVLTRLHSECFTGDLLGSLRCDCGDQLRGAIAEIARHGSGLLLYLAQEGRGIGLVNKLRAYRLQDGGADTLEANLQLGFDADERVYLPAAEMLRRLGFRRVRLMTNNPEKVAALAHCGIAVVERVPHVFPANGHNDHYLRTKATKFGHMF